MELKVGQTASRSLTLSGKEVRTFAELTGDRNPLHFDEDFAARTRFGRLVVQGGLTTGLLHALVAMDLPGPGTVFLSQNWKFTAPVFIGDTITAEVEVLSVHASKPVSQLGIRVRRQDGELVLEGEAWCYTMLPEAEGEVRLTATVAGQFGGPRRMRPSWPRWLRSCPARKRTIMSMVSMPSNGYWTGRSQSSMSKVANRAMFQARSDRWVSTARAGSNLE